MIKLDFDSPKNREKSLADLKALVDSQGWLLVKSIAYANIERIKEQILMGVEGESHETINRLRDRLRAYSDVIETPEKMIQKLVPTVELANNEDDPYSVMLDDGKIV